MRTAAAQSKKKMEEEAEAAKPELHEAHQPVAEQANLRIFVKDMIHRTMTLEVESTDNIETAKLMIQSDGGWRMNPGWIQDPGWRLIFAGKELEDGRTLADYNVQKESTLYLKKSMRGDIGWFDRHAGSPRLEILMRTAQASPAPHCTGGRLGRCPPARRPPGRTPPVLFRGPAPSPTCARRARTIAGHGAPAHAVRGPQA
jgi:hypothetical protein